jgi:hypothetical protein
MNKQEYCANPTWAPTHISCAIQREIQKNVTQFDVRLWLQQREEASCGYTV